MVTGLRVARTFLEVEPEWPEEDEIEAVKGPRRGRATSDFEVEYYKSPELSGESSLATTEENVDGYPTSSSSSETSSPPSEMPSPPLSPAAHDIQGELVTISPNLLHPGFAWGAMNHEVCRDFLPMQPSFYCIVPSNGEEHPPLFLVPPYNDESGPPEVAIADGNHLIVLPNVQDWPQSYDPSSQLAMMFAQANSAFQDPSNSFNVDVEARMAEWRRQRDAAVQEDLKANAPWRKKHTTPADCVEAHQFSRSRQHPNWQRTKSQAGPQVQQPGLLLDNRKRSPKTSTPAGGQCVDQMSGGTALKMVPDDERTTLMIRNLPQAFGRDTLVEMLEKEGFHGLFDFVYLPVDFQSWKGFGYAFVNLCTPHDALCAKSHFEGFLTLRHSPEDKPCEVCWGCPLQGLEAHIERYRNSPVMAAEVPDQYKPLILSNGVPVAFPAPTKRLRPPRRKGGAANAADCE